MNTVKTIAICFSSGLEIQDGKEILDSKTLQRCNKALELYNNKSVDRILCTGGRFIKGQKTSIAVLMKEYFISQGVPIEKIIIEANSVDTIENIDFSLDVLLKENLLGSGTRIILVSEYHHLQRVVISFQAILEKKGIIIAGLNTESVHCSLTKEQMEFEERLLKEVRNDPFGQGEEFIKERKVRREAAGSS